MVPEEKIDLSTENRVLMSEAVPKPADVEPATNESVPVRSWLASGDSAAGAVEPASSIRRMGRLEAERSTHFQSSSSVALAPRNGGNWMASNSPLSLRSTITLLPACNPTRSRSAGRNDGEYAFML